MVSSVVSIALIATGIGAVAAAPATAAEPAPALSVDKQLTQQIDDPTADNTILVGESVAYTLTVRNSGAAGVGRAYNVSASDVLPAGMSYTPGSSSLGEPKVIANSPSAGKTTLLWTNLFDVSPSGTATLEYSVTPDPAVLPVGATFTNSATVYGTNDPFDVSNFSATGACTAACDFAASDAQETRVNAIEIRKSEPSPESELLRGIHGSNSTTYTITVRNNRVNATTGIALTDYLPAGLEFLGCGAEDNTAGTLVEYDGASRLTDVPSIAAPPCRQPSAVDTVSADPDGTGPAPTAVYTKVTWADFDLAPGATRTFTYRAGIPLYANTVDWPAGTPSVDAGLQAANLDNNTGPSTAETPVEATYTNYVVGSGSYEGPGIDNPTGPVAIVAENTEVVTSEDLATTKSVRPSTFSIGGTATFTLTTRTSEYRSASDVSLVDTLPDGLGYVSGSLAATLDGAATTVDLDIDSSAAGTDTLTFTPAGGVLPAGARLVITFQATMDAEYASGAPTAAGDAYVNRVSTTGTSIPDVTPETPPGPGLVEEPIDVADTSSAKLTSSGPRAEKKIGTDRSTSDCSVQTYGDVVPSPPFQIGDTICFELNGDVVPTGDLNNVLSPVLRDFLPPTLRYVPGSAQLGPDNNIPDSQVRLDESGALAGPGGSVVWTLGETDPEATNPGQLVLRPTQAGAPSFFQVRFAAVVVSTLLDANKELTGNLLKATAVNSEGLAITGRDQVDFELAGSQVAISKGVAAVNGIPDPSFPPNQDDKTVKRNDVVTFRVDVTNIGTEGAGSNVPVRSISVIDDLPTGIRCAAISDISDSGACSDAATPSRITWTQVPRVIEAGQTATLTYGMAIPADVNVSTNYLNRATVTDYESLTNNTWIANQPVGITDVSNVRTSSVSVGKTGVTSLDLPNNNRAKQFTVGEEITYTVTGSIPAGTTARNGVIRDELPATLEFVRASAASNLSADRGQAAAPGDTLPSGAALARTGRVVTLALPASLTNETASPMTYTVTIVARVLGGTYTHGQTIRNTAKFSGGVPGSTFSASKSYDATVVIPNPVIAKSNAASGPVRPGVPVTFTLRVTNPASGQPARPVSYDTAVVDCLPSGMDPASVEYVSPATGDPVVAGDGSNGCPTGTTRLGWTVGAVATGSITNLTYKAALGVGEAAGASYTNEATVTGSTLDNGQRDPAVEGVLSASSTSTISSSNGEIAKSVNPPQAAVGDTVTWTVTTTYDDTARYYDAVVTDTIQPGVDLATVTTTRVTCSIPTACTDPVFGTEIAPSGRTVGWNIGDIGVTSADLVVTITYTARVESGQGSTAGTILPNTATSTWSTADGGPRVTGKSSTANLVVTRPRLSVIKDVDTSAPAPGAPFTYTVTVTNASGDLASDAFAIEVQDAVPDGVIVDDTTISDAGVLAGAGPNGGGTITWLLDGPLAPGGSLSLTYTAKLPSSATAGSFTNTVDVTSYASHPDHGDAYDDVPPAQATVSVGDPAADLAIVKTPSGATTPGSLWTFTMSVSNNGPSDAVGPITVIDELPDGMTFVAEGADWTCFPYDQTVFCAYFDDLAAGESAPDLRLTVQIAEAPENATYRNVASVESLTVDPEPSNNESSATVTVSPTPITPPGPDNPTDPTKPTTPTDPSKPTDPGNPTDPSRPTVVPQRPVTPLPLPDQLEPSRPTVVLPAGVQTNAGQRVRVDVQCRPLMRWTDKVALTLDGSWVPMGDVRYCDVRTSADGKVTVTSTYPGPVLVKAVFTAKQVPGYSDYLKVKRWVVVPR